MAAAAAWLATSPVWAQQDSVLARAVQLASEGQADSARAIVRRRLAAVPSNDSLYPQVLYTAGVVAGNVDSSMMYMRRVSIEYARSGWADRALLRMAQLAFATGDISAARRAAERILEDYPTSTVRADAGFWAGRAKFEQGDVAGGCDLLTGAELAAAENVELANRIRYYKQRCSTQQPRNAGDTVRSGTVYAVQVAAVQNTTAADDLVRQLAQRGHQAHIVVEGGLFKVRVGRFPQRAAAQQLVQELTRLLGGTPFIVEVP